MKNTKISSIIMPFRTLNRLFSLLLCALPACARQGIPSEYRDFYTHLCQPIICAMKLEKHTQKVYPESEHIMFKVEITDIIKGHVNCRTILVGIDTESLFDLCHGDTIGPYDVASQVCNRDVIFCGVIQNGRMKGYFEPYTSERYALFGAGVRCLRKRSPRPLLVFMADPSHSVPSKRVALGFLNGGSMPHPFCRRFLCGLRLWSVVDWKKGNAEELRQVITRNPNNIIGPAALCIYRRFFGKTGVRDLLLYLWKHRSADSGFLILAAKVTVFPPDSEGDLLDDFEKCFKDYDSNVAYQVIETLLQKSHPKIGAAVGAVLCNMLEDVDVYSLGGFTSLSQPPKFFSPIVNAQVAQTLLNVAFKSYFPLDVKVGLDIIKGHAVNVPRIEVRVLWYTGRDDKDRVNLFFSLDNLSRVSVLIGRPYSLLILAEKHGESQSWKWSKTKLKEKSIQKVAPMERVFFHNSKFVLHGWGKELADILDSGEWKQLKVYVLFSNPKERCKLTGMPVWFGYVLASPGGTVPGIRQR